ncbi:MAG: TolC family protein [Bryobacteraceae bacterium]|nr:TolC family protein [Bryobacteraceae bacterium]
MRIAPLLFAFPLLLSAEVHDLTLRQSVDRALRQNPEILMARFDELRAAENVQQVRDPFSPKLFVGSGLAYSSGMPMSIGGTVPAIIQAQATQTFYNKQLSYQVAAARENARGAGFDTSARRDQVVFQVANLHLAAARAVRLASLVRQQVESFDKIAGAVRARVLEGRELAIEARAADFRVAQAKQRLKVLESEQAQNEAALAIALGFPGEDRVRPVEEELPKIEMPASEVEAAKEALGNSKQLRRLESALQAKQLEAHSARAARYPKIDLVSQYALAAKFNNFEDYYRRFTRHNGQIGMSFQIPLFAGPAARSQAAAASIDMNRLRVEINATRDRIAVDARKSFQDVQTAQASRDLARMDLDITRERLGVALAQFEEGRLPLRQVEELRSAESEKWVLFYDAQVVAERAQLELLRQSGTILAALQQEARGWW